MRMIILTGVLAIALLGAVLGAISVNGASWDAAGDHGWRHMAPVPASAASAV